MSLEHVLNYLKRKHLENPSFSYALEQEDDNGNIFWADPTCRSNYAHFGDTLVFDTTYMRSNAQVPLVAFTGFNHHGQPLLFGCALLPNQSQSSFVWLFHSWLRAMSAPPPPSITLEPDPVIHLAASQAFPQARLRFSLPLIVEKLAHVFRSHPGFESEFLSCVSATETVGEFEGAWDSVVRRYCVEEDQWLQSIYNVRQQWVPVFIRDTFFGELCNNENSFFHGFVDASTTLEMVMARYEEAVNSWRVKELRADYESTNTTPVLKTASPMEKQAAGMYTRAAFMKFQEEFVEIPANPVDKMSDSTYRVGKFGQGHTVEFESLEVKANCSCRMFEYSGIVCRHILAVFSARNVFTLPSRYLLRRWTKEAKSSEFSNSGCQEALTVCYDNLRQEATKYVEEGAKSIQVYKAAVVALDEAAKKVAAASSKTRGGASNGESFRSDEAQETANGMNHPGVNELQCQGEKERTILELTAELERTGQRCEVYRANLLSVLRDMEEHKFQLSLKVQNARLSLKE